MKTYLKTGFAAAVVGLGIFATGGSAYAAGCLSPDQTNTSLMEQSDSVQDSATAADAKGFRCDVVGTEVSVRQPAPAVTHTKPKNYVQSAPQTTAPDSIMTD